MEELFTSFFSLLILIVGISSIRVAGATGLCIIEAYNAWLLN